MTYQNREEIEKKYTWDLKTRYKNDKAWKDDLNKVSSLLDEITKYKNKINDKNIEEVLDLESDLIIKIEKLYVYAHSKHDEDLENNKYNLMISQAINLYNIFSEKAAYIIPEILKYKDIDELINSTNKYKFALSNLKRSKKHHLSEREEIIVSKLTSTLSINENISNILTNSVIKFDKVKEIELLNSNYRNLITSPDREIRKSAFYNLTKELKKYETIYGLNLLSTMKLRKELAEIYNFNSVLDMDLFSSNLSKEIYTNVYKVTNKRLNVYQKYFNMIKDYLKLDKLEYYDKDTNLITLNKKFEIKEAKEILLSSLSILGDEYISIIKKAFDDRWIDFGVYKGKTSSIYATSNYGDTPLVMANYLGEFNDISTLAHELGHAAHFYLSKDNHYHESDTDLFTAEVASLTNEILFSNYIVKTSEDKNLKLSALHNIMSTIQNNLFDALLEGELEHQIYESKEEFTPDDLSKMIYKIRKTYYNDSVNLNDNVSIMWSRRTHYFRPYYLYKYATGIISAIYIANKILNNDKKMLNNYLNFLKSGSTDYPENLLKKMGVDLTKEEVINDAINYFDNLIDQFIKISKES